MLDTNQKDILIQHLSAENAELRLLLLQYRIVTAPVEEGESDAPDTD